MTMLSI